MKISDLIKNKKILIVGVIILIVVALLLIFNGRGGAPAPTPSPAPTISPLGEPRISPISGAFAVAGTLNGITIEFDKPVDTSTVRLKSIPSLTFMVTTRKDIPNGIVVSPQTPWEKGSYTITLEGGIFSVDKKSAYNNDIVLKYTITTPPLPDYKYERPGGI